MKASELDLSDWLNPRPDDGILELSGARAIWADAAATFRLAEELEETLGEEAARGVLTRYGYQSGYQDATRLRTYFTWDSDVEWLHAAARTRTLQGVGKIHFAEVSVDRAQGAFKVLAEVDRSFEAEEYKNRLGPSDGGVCHRLVGYLTGFGSACMGDEVLFVETACAGTSDDLERCVFEGRVASEWGDAGAAHLARYRHDRIGQRLAQRDREVFAQAVKIREQELELAAQRKLEEASRLKSEFLANISHELRTPLNSIIGYSDLLLAKIGAKLPPTPRKNMERILANAEHLLGLINSILDISKIEAGRMELHLEPVDFGEVLRRCVEDTRVLLKDKPVELEVAGGDDLPQVWADATRLRQCLTNVLGNAAKFTAEGTIHLGVEARTSQREGETRRFLSVTVRDSGPGIPEPQHALIFEPFRQADGSGSREHEGTGLGLPIVRELLTLMGGEIRLTHSELGVGSTFTLVVPCTQRQTPQAEEAQPEPEPSESGERVLVVEDDPDAGEILRTHLERLLPAREVRVESDPAQALAQARREPPALLLLDLKLPSIDGREVLRLLRDDPRTRATPVIVCSVRDDRQETLREGALAALDKPLDPHELEAAVRKVFPAARAPTLDALVIEDDPDAGEILRERLRRLGPLTDGWRVEIRSDPVQALSVARATPPRLVILDLQLPKLDGREVLRQLRELPETRDVPVIVVSTRDDLRETVSEGALAALTKPVHPDELDEVVREALGGSA